MKHINRLTAICLSVCMIGTVLSGCSDVDTAFLLEKNSYCVQTDIATVLEHSKSEKIGGFVQQKNLCVNNADVIPEKIGDFYSGGLFDLDNGEVLYAKNLHEKRTPASITKIMTAYVVLKYANLEDMVTASQNVLITEPGAKLCGFLPGDQVSVKNLLFALIVYSGNDAGVMLAEHVSGTAEAFCELMNKEARALGATNTHFLNPHGLTVDGHYTTAYDLYLIFNELIKNALFLEMIQSTSVQFEYISAGGEQKLSQKFLSSNQYFTGNAAIPKGITVVGGKTGYTAAAGGCLILLAKDSSDHPYIAIVLNAKDKKAIYQQMSQLLSEISK